MRITKQVEDAKMYGMPEFIVCMWFLPVTIFIIIPLIMLVAWAIIKLFRNSRFNRILPKSNKA